jgi:ribosomal protein S27AE
MDILSDKIVTTRKKHNCSACGRVFDKGTKMRTQVNTYDGIQTWRECPTCQELLSKHRSRFDDGYNVCWMNCVDEALERGQTPEDLLSALDNVL